MVAHVVGVLGDSSIRCHLVWCDEISLGFGGLVDGDIGGHPNGDNQGDNCGSDATYLGAFFYM